MTNKSAPLYYFDYQSTTPMDKRVIDAVYKSMQEDYGNPHSTSHPLGWKAIEKVENARMQVAKVINASADDIIFTSGATESNNLAIKGAAHFYQSKGKHIITMSVEHKCVLESCKILETEGFEITYLDPEIDGLLDLNKLKDAIRKDTILISVMGVNNETGVIQNLEEIGKIAHEHGILFHTDCAQAFGKIPLDVKRMHIDLMSISSHKIYGPKGIGALYVRQKPKVRLVPIIHGGGQEKGIRSGTLSTPLCVGFGLASQIIHAEMEQDRQHIQRLADSFLDRILQLEDVYLNGSREHKIPGCINISFLHIEGESLMLAIQNMCISTGSACNSANLQPSYVISKMRRDEYYAHSAMRFGMGRFTTQKEVNALTRELIKAVNHLRSISPLWEMKKQGIDFNKIAWDEH